MRSSLYKFLTKEAGQVEPATPQKPSLTLQTPDIQVPSVLDGVKINTTPPAEIAPISTNTNVTPSNGNIVFRNGHTVKFDPSKVDWTTPDGPTPNNIGGTWYTDDQYNALDSIRKQLYSSYTSQGMDSQKARNLATRRAKQYVGDQMQMARGGTAFNKWKDQPAPAVAQDIPTQAMPAEEDIPVTDDTQERPKVLTIGKPGEVKIDTISPVLPVLLQKPTKKSAPVSPQQEARTAPQEERVASLDEYLSNRQEATKPNTTLAYSTPEVYIPQEWDQASLQDSIKNMRSYASEGLVPVDGYKHIYINPKDPSQTVRDRLGRPIYEDGGRLTGAWLKRRGSAALHNAETWAEHQQNLPYHEELKQHGFNPYLGNSKVYINDRGDIVDPYTLKLYPKGTPGALLDDRSWWDKATTSDAPWSFWDWYYSKSPEDVTIQE